MFHGYSNLIIRKSAYQGTLGLSFIVYEIARLLVSKSHKNLVKKTQSALFEHPVTIKAMWSKD
jgi:hypothetical protein